MNKLGYNPKDIENSHNRFPFHLRDTILNRDNTNKPEHQPIVVPVKYKHWSKVSMDPNLNTHFPNKPMLAYKKNPSLANKLVGSKIKTPIQTDSDAPRSHITDPLPVVD